MPPPVVRFRRELLACGYRSAEVRRLRASGTVVPLRPGAYADSGDERLSTPVQRHALLVRATVAQLGPDLVASHVSAALLLGIDVWAVALDRVHVTRPGSSGGRRSRHLQVHVTALEPDEIVSVDGLQLTGPARTVADLLRSLPFEKALVVADSALHRHLVTRAEIATALARAPRRHGTAAALRVLACADGRAESPGESRSRARMREAGLPPPELQVPVLGADGRALGRVDFGWPGVVGEFDGRVKYGRLLRPGQEPGDAVFAEKVREDAIRDTGLRVVRWTWPELEPFAAVAERLRRALASARPVSRDR